MDTRPLVAEELRREALRQLFARLTQFRKWLTPFRVVICLALAAVDDVPWRRAAFVALAVLTALASLAEDRRVVRLGVERQRDYADALLGVSFFLVVPISGGVESPFLSQMVLGAIIGAFFFSGRIAAAVSACIAAGTFGLATLAWLSDRFPGFSLFAVYGHHTTPFYFLTALALSVYVIVGRRLGANIRGMTAEMLARSIAVRDESLRAHVERTRDLTTLSAEIAHELKNPLTSIKGLASLMAMDPGRAKERLAVLRPEIARMRGVLREFLDFSRPLMPLALEPVDLARLADDVRYLHEGVAAQRGVTLQLAPHPALSARCDGRKIKQVLINLMQNALDASAAGSVITIELQEKEGGWARLRICDRGSGLPAQLGARVCEPGVTTKSHGSGLGLTIVRAIADQHGGHFALADRDGGGCVAELLLPIAGAAALAPALQAQA
jgi:two-component system sensor histidine kinase HydH